MPQEASCTDGDPAQKPERPPVLPKPTTSKPPVSPKPPLKPKPHLKPHPKPPAQGMSSNADGLKNSDHDSVQTHNQRSSIFCFCFT